MIAIADQLQIFSKYIGQTLWLRPLDGLDTDQFVELAGIKREAILVRSEEGYSRWIPLSDDFQLYDIKLLLKPLKRLTPDVKQIANQLPIQNFITQYYIQLGFDMPVFLHPDHPDNCKYVAELGLADYRDRSAILAELNHLQAAG